MRDKVVLLIFLFLIISCGSDNEPKAKEKTVEKKVFSQGDTPKYIKNNKVNNLNISILLDLSDRIDNDKYPNPTMAYYKRDLGYIQSVFNSFIGHVKEKKFILWYDGIQIYFEPLPLDQTINQKSKNLKKFFSKPTYRKNYLEESEDDYLKLPEEIYNLAIKDDNYVGSDIWRFFKDKVRRYTINDSSRNILVILTDGYIYHKDTKLIEDNMSSYITPQTLRDNGLTKSNWKAVMSMKKFGFIPATDNLQDLEVLVLGIENHDKKRNPYGKDVITKYWKDWFKSMNVGRYEVYGAEIPSNMEKTISDFIRGN